MNLASLGAIAGGINQGLEYSQRDKERKDNQEFLKNQRQFLQDQQAQQKDQWKRDDEFAAAWNEASSPTKTVTQSVPDLASETVDENGDLPMTQVAVTVPRTNVEIAGAQHASALKARRYDLAEKALESKNRYIREGDLNLYRDFDTSLGGELNDDVASRVQKMVTSDGTPIGIDGYKANGDGSYTFNVRNKFNDFAVPVTVRSPDELRSVIRQHLDYNGYAAEQAERRKLSNEIARDESKPFDLAPGGIRVNPRTGDRWVNPNRTSADVANDKLVAALSGQLPGRGSSSAGGGRGSSAAEIVMDQATKGEIKLVPDQLSDAQMRAAMIESHGAPPYVAANVALKIAQNPKLVTPRVNLASGLIEGVYEDPSLGQVVVDKNFAEARRPNTITKKQMEGFAKQIVDAQPDSIRDELVASAFDAKKARILQDKVAAEINTAFDEQIKKYPQARQQIEAQRNATIESTLQSLARKRDLIYGHYPNPEAAKKAPVSVPAVGGLFSGNKYTPAEGSKAAEWVKRQEAAKAKAAEQSRLRAEAAAETSKQFSEDAKSLNPEDMVRKYDGIRGQLSVEDRIKLREIERRL